jgi:Fe-S cluster assembly ATP-binding protein
MTTLEIRNLHATVGGTPILTGIDLTVSSGEVHAVMGPNGAGKSTLSAVLMGKPGYQVTSGTVTLDGVDVLSMATWQRSQAGLHLVMQYPVEVPGVYLDDLMVQALEERGWSTEEVAARLETEAEAIGLHLDLLHRALNVDMSGGEKKRNETVQLAVLQPRIAILDELDSGLDIDALRDCARRVERATNEGDPPLGVLAITHYNRLLQELRPDHVHILVSGRIVASGGPDLADQLERDGYAAFADGADLPDGPDSGLADLFARR